MSRPVYASGGMKVNSVGPGSLSGHIGATLSQDISRCAGSASLYRKWSVTVCVFVTIERTKVRPNPRAELRKVTQASVAAGETRCEDPLCPDALVHKRSRKKHPPSELLYSGSVHVEALLRSAGA